METVAAVEPKLAACAGGAAADNRPFIVEPRAASGFGSLMGIPKRR